MRSKKIPDTKTNDLRIVQRFLFLPRVLPIGPWPGAEFQWRWLEKAHIQQFVTIHIARWLPIWDSECWADWKED